MNSAGSLRDSLKSALCVNLQVPASWDVELVPIICQLDHQHLAAVGDEAALNKQLLLQIAKPKAPIMAGLNGLF